MNPTPERMRRTGLGWTLMGAGWALFAATAAVALTTSPGIPTLGELVGSGRVLPFLPAVVIVGLLTLFGSRAASGAPWGVFHFLVPLLCVGGFLAAFGASGQALFFLTGDRAECTVAGEDFRPVPQKGDVLGWYRVVCPGADHVLARHRGDDSRKAGERVEVVSDPDGRLDPIFADTVDPFDALPLIVLPLAFVVAPPVVLSRLRGARRRPGRVPSDDARGPFAGNWPTPPGGPAR